MRAGVVGEVSWSMESTVKWIGDWGQYADAVRFLFVGRVVCGAQRLEQTNKRRYGNEGKIRENFVTVRIVGNEFTRGGPAGRQMLGDVRLQLRGTGGKVQLVQWKGGQPEVPRAQDEKAENHHLFPA